MKKIFATLLVLFSTFQGPLSAFDYELNASYDYFRGLSEGSWNGNTGGYLSGNISGSFYDAIHFQLGGSVGVYNWDGRQNLVFHNTKNPSYQTFATGGFYYSECGFNFGLLYDRMITQNFGLFDLSPTVDQLRFQVGYGMGEDEIGLWGTQDLNTSYKKVFGTSIAFRAINQANVFWMHNSRGGARTMFWLGVPYKNSLMHDKNKPGKFIAGFSVRAPLCGALFLEGHGSYMAASSSSHSAQYKNYGANVAIGLTFLFGDRYRGSQDAYMPVANNSNFMIDTNLNQ